MTMTETVWSLYSLCEDYVALETLDVNASVDEFIESAPVIRLADGRWGQGDFEIVRLRVKLWYGRN